MLSVKLWAQTPSKLSLVSVQTITFFGGVTDPKRKPKTGTILQTFIGPHPKMRRMFVQEQKEALCLDPYCLIDLPLRTFLRYKWLKVLLCSRLKTLPFFLVFQ